VRQNAGKRRKRRRNKDESRVRRKKKLFPLLLLPPLLLLLLHVLHRRVEWPVFQYSLQHWRLQCCASSVVDVRLQGSVF
jgi:hypothetical protein